MTHNPPFTSYQDQVTALETDIQTLWDGEAIDRVDLSRPTGSRRYVLGMFPYPSGNAHLGHILVYTLSDCLARLGRYKGAAVINPLGWDAFGLPAENAAIKNNQHPGIWTQANIRRMRDEQIRRAGFSFDLNLEIDTSSPDYYRWTQWLFLKLHEHGQAYRAKSWVNWDPVDETVLANEQVIDGRGWRSGAPIERRLMEQWCLRITDFAEALWQGLDELQGWSERSIAAQRHWIGRSEGADIDFRIEGATEVITAFTTRADTLFGVTSLTLAPEHPLLLELAAPDARAAVDAYAREALKKSEVERQAADQKTGVALGRNAVHPLTGERIPVYVADYVLDANGTSAVMNVPAHDPRDFEFARAMGLPIHIVVVPPGDSLPQVPFEQDATLVASGDYTGLSSAEARMQIVDALYAAGAGRQTIRYRLRDWAISRQRFWGVPIPMLRAADGSWERVREQDLPVLLPAQAAFRNGRSPLASDAAFMAAVSPSTGETMTREVDTMDTFMCSAWYAWRFLDAHNADAAWRPDRARMWMPIDYYVGGLEHANQHLIYFRYLSHFLHSIGLTPTREPIRNFLDNGVIRLGGQKMSKSRGNTVTPDEVIAKYGADALRLYILSDTPFERDRDWDESGLEAKQRFLSRVHALFVTTPLLEGIVTEPPVDVTSVSSTLVMRLQRAALSMERQIDDNRSFHTAIATLHTVYNELAEAARGADTYDRRALTYCMQLFLKMLSLFTPHLADWIWRRQIGAGSSIFRERWPALDADALQSVVGTTIMAVQINGRLRGQLSVPADASDEALKIALFAGSEPPLGAHLRDRTVKRVVVVRDATRTPRLVNVVVEDA